MIVSEGMTLTARARAAELAIASWRDSFCGIGPHQTSHLAIATPGRQRDWGGDWAEDRIVPDAMRALVSDQPICAKPRGHPSLAACT